MLMKCPLYTRVDPFTTFYARPRGDPLKLFGPFYLSSLLVILVPSMLFLSTLHRIDHPRNRFSRYEAFFLLLSPFSLIGPSGFGIIPVCVRLTVRTQPDKVQTFLGPKSGDDQPEALEHLTTSRTRRILSHVDDATSFGQSLSSLFVSHSLSCLSSKILYVVQLSRCFRVEIRFFKASINGKIPSRIVWIQFFKYCQPNIQISRWKVWARWKWAFVPIFSHNFGLNFIIVLI